MEKNAVILKDAFLKVAACSVRLGELTYLTRVCRLACSDLYLKLRGKLFVTALTTNGVHI